MLDEILLRHHNSIVTKPRPTPLGAFSVVLWVVGDLGATNVAHWVRTEVVIASESDTIWPFARRERRISDYGAERLDGGANGFTLVSLPVLHIHLGRTRTMLCGYILGTPCVVPEEAQVLVLKPESDAAVYTRRQIAQAVLGIVRC